MACHLGFASPLVNLVLDYVTKINYKSVSVDSVPGGRGRGPGRSARQTAPKNGPDPSARGALFRQPTLDFQASRRPCGASKSFSLSRIGAADAAANSSGEVQNVVQAQDMETTSQRTKAASAGARPARNGRKRIGPRSWPACGKSGAPIRFGERRSVPASASRPASGCSPPSA